MSPRRSISRFSLLLTVAMMLALCGATHVGAADGLYSGGMFELGDGNPPSGFSAMANVLADGNQLGPDWGEVFNDERSVRYDNIKNYGGQWAVFVADDISLGSGFESTALAGSNGFVENGTVDADHDIGNAYVYSTSDSLGNLVLYAGAERLGGGSSYLEFEFNQEKFSLGHGGYGQGVPWEILGARSAGDVLVRVAFTKGAIGSMVVYSWSGTDWQALVDIDSEGCDLAERACVIANGSSIDGGPWPNFDTVDDPGYLSAYRFVEFGVNVGALLRSQPDYTTVQIRTPQDIAFGYFKEGN